MEEILIKNKEEYLQMNYPFENPPSLNEKRQCLHCDNVFEIREFKVYKDSSELEYICCPHAPECDGSVIDWIQIEPT